MTVIPNTDPNSGLQMQRNESNANNEYDDLFEIDDKNQENAITTLIDQSTYFILLIHLYRRSEHATTKYKFYRSKFYVFL